jgi:group I intron endonuclease
MHVLPSARGVYRFVHLDTGRSYVGAAKNMKGRLTAHRHLVRHGSGSHIHNAIRAYGWESFSVEVLELCETETDTLAAEVFWVDWYDAMSPSGFNLTSGGEKSKHISDATRVKMSASNRGRKHSAESRALMSAQRKGRPVLPDGPTPEMLEKRRARWASKTDAERAQSAAHLLGVWSGKTHSAETRARMSAARTAYWNKRRGEAAS